MKKEIDKIGRRLNISAERWLELVAEFRKSDLPLKEFADSKGVNPHTFRYWTYDRNRLRKKKKSAKRKPQVFVEVSAPVNTGSTLEIQMPNGVRMNLESASRDDVSFFIREVARCLD